jgi:hypothetical protein
LAIAWRQPEVQELDAMRRKEHVGRLQIAVQQAAPVQRRQRVQHRPGDGERLVYRHGTALETRRERLAFEQLHDCHPTSCSVLRAPCSALGIYHAMP